jgi:hypothetical protein
MAFGDSEDQKPSAMDHLCHLCGQAVPLESAKTDDDGKVVHEKCYVLRIVSRDKSGDDD